MKVCKHPGFCKLCGEFKDLTKEHVPPKKAFNDGKVMEYSVIDFLGTFGNSERMPWDYPNTKGRIQQNGHKQYYLCEKCNNNTGSWYMEEYVKFAHAIAYMLSSNSVKPISVFSFEMKIHPLRLIKAILTMFCDINDNCFGDEGLRAFLLDKESNNFDKNKYRVFLYFVSEQMVRLNALSVIYLIGTNTYVTVSEINHYPIGLALFIDKPNEYYPLGIDITEFVNYGYDDETVFRLNNAVYLDINAHFSQDFRGKDEIIKCIEENTEAMKRLKRDGLIPKDKN